MLRKIISVYKAVFMVICGLLLAGTFALGFYVMIEGQNPSDRWRGVGLMVGGSLFVLALAGNFSLVLENNELLRRIAEQASSKGPPNAAKSANQVGPRTEPTLTREKEKLS